MVLEAIHEYLCPQPQLSRKEGPAITLEEQTCPPQPCEGHASPSFPGALTPLKKAEVLSQGAQTVSAPGP